MFCKRQHTPGDQDLTSRPQTPPGAKPAPSPRPARQPLALAALKSAISSSFVSPLGYHGMRPRAREERSLSEGWSLRSSP